ncbi:MAG: serine/threonine protein kinase, partial [Candidatus Eremiobacterota bacterium]
MHLKVGEILDNRYSIITLVKIGGMSNIYKAEDKRLNKICAVKELLDKSDEPEESEYVIKRFREEAKLLAELYHPNLPRVSDYFINDIRY